MPKIMSEVLDTERVGFEPTVRIHAQQFSRLPHSAALAPLLQYILTQTCAFATRHPLM